MPEQLEESSIADDTTMQYDGASLPTVTTYQVIEDSSQKGKENWWIAWATPTQSKCGESMATEFGDAAYETK